MRHFRAKSQHLDTLAGGHFLSELPDICVKISTFIFEKKQIEKSVRHNTKEFMIFFPDRKVNSCPLLAFLSLISASKGIVVNEKEMRHFRAIDNDLSAP